MKAIHQFLAGYSNGDAISNEARALRTIFRAWGFASEIYCEERRILPELRKECRDLGQAAADLGADDIALLHLSIGSDLNDLFPKLPGRKAILYHNITPPEFFRGIQDQIASLLARGREQAARLHAVAEVNLADSAYNAEELAGWGYRDPKVLPLVLDFDHLAVKPDRATLKKYGDGRTNILFVGRCVPNKRIEDLLAAFYYVQKYVDDSARLIHTGSWAGTERYHALLLTGMRDLQVEGVEMPGSVRQDELAAIYRSAHVFLSMSEHEGFCIPVIEAMYYDVPVLAYAGAAVPGTMDGAGVLFKEKRFDEVAEMIGRLAHDPVLREAVLRGQRARVERYRARDLAAELRALLAPLM